jgi:hypothetical protein
MNHPDEPANCPRSIPRGRALAHSNLIEASPFGGFTYQLKALLAGAKPTKRARADAICLSVVVTGAQTSTQPANDRKDNRKGSDCGRCLMTQRNLIARSWRADTARKRRCKLCSRCSGPGPGRKGLGFGRCGMNWPAWPSNARWKNDLEQHPLEPRIKGRGTPALVKSADSGSRPLAGFGLFQI